MAEQNTRLARERRHRRVRNKVNGTADRPRLCVFRSLNHIYAQIVDDAAGNTLISASSLDAEIKSKMNGLKKTAIADVVGSVMAERAIGKGIKQVVFDRGGYKYHGRVGALAAAARNAGLEF